MNEIRLLEGREKVYIKAIADKVNEVIKELIVMQSEIEGKKDKVEVTNG